MNYRRDIKQLLNKAFGGGTPSRDGINYSLRCPTCNDTDASKRKLVVRLDDGRFHCWVCETKGGNILRLIGKYRPELVRNISLEFRSDNPPDDIREKVELPKNTVLLGAVGDKTDPDIKAVFNYLQRRGATRRDMLRWRMLSCSTGRFRRRVIIPSFDDCGEINFYVARTIDQTKKMKYLNARVSKDDVVFNEIDLDWSKEIILVEGVFDAIKCPENAVPILGSSISKNSALLKKISTHQSPCVVSLDPDMKHKAFALADSLVSFGCDVKIAFAPPRQDVGSMEKSDVRNLLSSAAIYNDMMRISHKINGIKSGSIF